MHFQVALVALSLFLATLIGAQPPEAATSSCDVTIPNGSNPPVKHFGGTMTYSPDYKGPRYDYFPNSHGNGKLWVLLEPEGKLVVKPNDDGSLTWGKLLWWRGVRGRLAIEGKRKDAPAGAAKAYVSPYYGETGLQITGIVFPSEGCWEVTGKAGDAELTFVVEVRAEESLKATR